MSQSLLGQIRPACEEVTSRARYVHVNVELIPSYAASLPLMQLKWTKVDPRDDYSGTEENVIAFILTLDSINFGSGYFPHLRKPADASGYFMIASALKNRFDAKGPITPQELVNLEARHCAEIFHQDLNDDSRRELMTLYSSALNDLGRFILDRFNGQYSNLVAEAKSSVEALVQILIEMPYFRDVARYNEIIVPFYKRAQITAADLYLRFNGRGPGYFHDLERLTIFADNAVPNVLRVDGILSYEETLASRIAMSELIAAGSEEEIEIRASAVHAVELIVEQLRDVDDGVISMGIDFFLWNRGHIPKYQATPRHLTRTVFY